MNINFVRMCLKNATDEVNSFAVSDNLKKEFFQKMIDVTKVLQKIERAKK